MCFPCGCRGGAAERQYLAPQSHRSFHILLSYPLLRGGGGGLGGIALMTLAVLAHDDDDDDGDHGHEHGADDDDDGDLGHSCC